MTNPLSSALAVLDRYPASDDSQKLIVAKARGLMAGYEARWHDQPYLIDQVEQVVEAPLWNPETKRGSRSFRLAGKLDITGWHGNRRILMDHKTCGEDIADPMSPYWQQMTIEAQPTHYMYMEWLSGRKVDDAVWDITRKPSISPKLLSKADYERARLSKHYFGRKLSGPVCVGDGRETFEMYEARVAHDCTTERPQWYFQRRSVPRLDSQLHAWAVDLWGHSQDVLRSRLKNWWPQNDKACMYKGSSCRFLGICSGHDAPDSDKWTRRGFVHIELPQLAGISDGRDVLTKSSVGTFQLCKRKYLYAYEMGLEKVEKEEAESLWFGHCWHAALEAYFLAVKSEQEKHSDTSVKPVTEIGSDRNEAPVYF